VRDLEGKSFTVEKLTSATSVKGLKDRLVEKTGMRYWPKLKYGTHARLDDDVMLSAYGITKDATLEVTWNMPGGTLAGPWTTEADPFAAESSSGGLERQCYLAEIQRLAAENERLEAQVTRLEAQVRASGSGIDIPALSDDGEAHRQHSPNRDEIRRLTADIQRLHVRLEAELSLRDVGVGDSRGTISAPSPVALLDKEAREALAVDRMTADVLPIVDDRDARMDMSASNASVECGGSQMSSLEFLQSRMGLAGFAHDGAWRDAMIDEMRKGGQFYNEEEAELIASATDLLRSFDEGKGKVRPMKHAKTVEMARTKHDKTSGLLLGEVKLLVRASPEQVVAFLMHFDSNFHLSRIDPNVEVRYEVLEVQNPHRTAVLAEVNVAPFRNRIILNTLLWKKISNEPLTYLWAAVPIKCHDKLQPDQEVHAVRAELKRVCQLTRTSDGATSSRTRVLLTSRETFRRIFRMTSPSPS
jgi:hypothetical protein